MQGMHAASNITRQTPRAPEAQRYRDDPDLSTGLLGSTRIGSSRDEGRCSGLWQRMTDLSHAHPRIGHAVGVVGGLLTIAAGVVTLVHKPDALLVPVLLFVGGTAGLAGTAIHCYMDTHDTL